MSQGQSNPMFTVDVEIRFRSRVFSLKLGSVFKWLVPIAFAAAKLIMTLRHV